MIHATHRGATAAPICTAANMSPLARPTSCGGNHSAMVLEALGGKGPSLAPKRTRIPSNTGRLPARPVSTVKKDQPTMARIMTRRGPKRSANIPPGSCMRA